MIFRNSVLFNIVVADAQVLKLLDITIHNTDKLYPPSTMKQMIIFIEKKSSRYEIPFDKKKEKEKKKKRKVV